MSIFAASREVEKINMTRSPSFAVVQFNFAACSVRADAFCIARATMP